MAKASNTWTPDMLDALAEMAESGKASSAIAAELNARFCPPVPITRNAVIGQCTRGRIQLRNSNRFGHNEPVKRPAPPAPPAPAGRSPVRRPPTPPVPARPPAPAGGVPLLKLRDYHCRWVFDNGMFCGNHAPVGSSWCPEHRALVFSPTDARGRRIRTA